jgi:predicted DsbA family dithiol-disulfide isomerase
MEGMSIEDLLAGRNIDLAEMRKRLKAAADNAGLLYTGPKMACNSRLAQEMGKWVKEQGKGDAFHLAVFKSYFVEEKNIGDAAVLVDIAEKIGLSKKSAQDVLKNRSFQEDVDQDWERSKMVGISAVPTFIMGQQRLVGAQSYDDLKRFVENAISV